MSLYHKDTFLYQKRDTDNKAGASCKINYNIRKTKKRWSDSDNT